MPAGNARRSRSHRFPEGGPQGLIFRETELKGAFIIDCERREDERGFFARTFCSREFAAHGLDQTFVQCNISFNKRKGTLRGMHFQAAPYEETKLVRCSRGSICDVIIDLRRESPTFKRHVAVTLSAENGRMLYIPKGFAHGFQTLEDHTEVFYQMGEYYAPEYQKGVRWDDQAFGIEWPAGEKIIIERDRSYPLFTV
jgi:dTDP-4-dehydrorhamnose 3,5-epimerase